MNPEGGAGMNSCLSDHTGDSDNNHSFRYQSDITNGRNIDLFGGDSDIESQREGADSDRQTFSPSEFLGQPVSSIHFDMCIILTFLLFIFYGGG